MLHRKLFDDFTDIFCMTFGLLRQLPLFSQQETTFTEMCKLFSEIIRRVSCLQKRLKKIIVVKKYLKSPMKFPVYQYSVTFVRNGIDTKDTYLVSLLWFLTNRQKLFQRPFILKSNFSQQGKYKILDKFLSNDQRSPKMGQSSPSNDALKFRFS